MYGFNDAFQDHEKFFFILQQYHESITDRFSTTLLDINKELINPYSYSKEEMPKIKFSNFILEGLEKILDKIEDSTKLKIHPNHIKRMLLVKTEYLNDFDIEFDQYIIYLPQTNQIFYTSNKNLGFIINNTPRTRRYINIVVSNGLCKLNNDIYER